MSKKAKSLRDRLSKLVAREISRGTSEDDIVGALEIVKCNVAIAAAQANAVMLSKHKTKNHEGN